MLLINITSASAQISTNPLEISGDVSLVATPQYPKPGESVRIEAEVSGLNLADSTVTWTVNGEKLLSGRGEDVLTLTMGKEVSSTNVSVTVDSTLGTLQGTLVLNASEIDFLYQGDAYTPPFYNGRALWSKQSPLIITAIPHIAGVSNIRTLGYRWSQGSTVIPSSSGVGNNSLVLPPTIIPQTQLIKLEVLGSGNVVLASRTHNISPIESEVLVYEDSPLTGFQFHKEVGTSYVMREREVTLAGFPTFFNTPSRLVDNIFYEWRTNAGVTEKKASVTYRIPDGASGTSQINLRVKNGGSIMQNVSKNFLIKFGE